MGDEEKQAKSLLDLGSMMSQQNEVVKRSQSQAEKVLANEEERNRLLKRIAEAVEKIAGRQ